jgi:branched-chain amino acid transport system substrate-binding protein
MKKSLILGCAAIALAAGPANGAELRIGFVTTTSGGAAIIGKQMVNAWKLGLEHEGWTKDGDKLGGVPTKVFYGDDQRKADVGRRVVTRMIRSDKVHLIAGIIWSNVLMAVQRPVIRAKKGLVITNAGAAPMAGKQCSPYFISTSWNNDQPAEAMGKLMSDEGVKTVFVLAPNYQAGKDMLSGFKRTYKGKIVGQTLFKLGQRDYQAEISKARAAKADAVYIFAPGGMGISFVKQWNSSGANKAMKLYSVFVVDNLTLPAIGEAALGTYHTNYWDVTSDNPVNQKFIKDYSAKYGALPSHYAAQTYDAPRLIAAAVRKINGKINDRDSLNLMKAMRKVEFPSVRGPFKYNVNGIPIQNFYKREVVKGPDGKPMIKTTGVVVKNDKDSYWQQCPKSRRY